MYYYFDAEGSQVTQDTVSHYKYIKAQHLTVYAPEPTQYILWFGHWGSLSFWFSFIYK
jgi:hypothetical protein